MRKLDFGEAMALIKERFPNSTNEYPLLPQDGGVRSRYLINHSIFHTLKVLGTIAAECEASDHGKPLEEKALKRAAAKMVVNSLKMVMDLGMTPESLIAEMDRLVRTDIGHDAQ